jgi:hypothetical protein
MESQAFKLLLAFAGIMAVGFIIVGTTRETQQEKVQGAFLQTANMLGSLSLGKCADAVRKEVGTEPFNPSETASDHMSYVTMIWKNIGTAKQVECRYVMDQGITLLKVDDRTVIENTAVQTGASGAVKAPGVHH